MGFRLTPWPRLAVEESSIGAMNIPTPMNETTAMINPMIMDRIMKAGIVPNARGKGTGKAGTSRRRTSFPSRRPTPARAHRPPRSDAGGSPARKKATSEIRNGRSDRGETLRVATGRRIRTKRRRPPGSHGQARIHALERCEAGEVARGIAGDELHRFREAGKGRFRPLYFASHFESRCRASS